MPEVTDTPVQHLAEIAVHPDDALTTAEWLAKRNAPPSAQPTEKPEVESKTAEATEPSQQEQERDEQGKFVSPGVQKRIDKAIAKQRDAEREAGALREQLQKLQGEKPAPVVVEKPAEEVKAPIKPVLKDFANFEEYEEAKDKYYEASAEHKAKAVLAEDRKQRADAERKTKEESETQAMQSEWKASEDSARETHDDYDDKIAELNADIRDKKAIALSANLLGAVVASDAKAQLLYFLATNREELERLNSVPLHKVGYELGKIEAKLTSPAPTKPVPEKKDPKPPVKPKPPEPVTGKAAASSGPSDDDSPEEWQRKRTLQRQAQGHKF